MKADITRSTFNKNKKYTKVNAQQGRIQVDADWNEQLDIQEHFNKTILCDLVGKTGTPIEDNGFEISCPVGKAATPSFTIGKGRYYVDGIICENNSNNLDAQDQEDLLYSPLFEQLFADMIKKHSIPSTVPSIASKKYGYYVVYLDVWQRHITSLEDPDLQEVALGRTDTTTRTKNVWQVKTLLYDDIENAQKAIAEFERPIPCERGTLQVKLKESSDSDSSEGIPTGYSGDENRLYRVEIHSCEKGGSEQSVTFKWSKENAIVAAKISEVSVSEDISDSTSDSLLMSITIENSGKADDLYTSNNDQWIELTDDYHELWNIPGSMLLIDAVEAVPQENKSILKVKVKKDIKESSDPLLYHIVNKNVLINSDDNSDDKRVLKNPTVRRWDAFETIADADMTKDAKYLDLDAGIQLRFDGGAYTRGDYWLIPARTITKNIEWPTDGDGPVALPSAMEHHYCSLALLHYSPAEFVVECDYRNFFPTGTSAALNFYSVSGDGQKITPKNVYLDPVDVGLSVVPLELCVGASIGDKPVGKTIEDRFFVHFEIDVDDDTVGKLLCADSEMHLKSECDVPFTGGIAKCDWVFCPNDDWYQSGSNKVTPGNQRVSATLKLKSGFEQDGVSSCLVAPVYFNATFVQPELRYVSGDGQNKRVDGFAPLPLEACLEVAGEPLTESYRSLWKAKAQFTIDSNSSGSLFLSKDGSDVVFGSLRESDTSSIFPNPDGVVGCYWKLDGLPEYQQVKARLVNYNNDPFGSILFFKTTLQSFEARLSSAISGVIELVSPSNSVGPLISNAISHTLTSDVPPAILLSLIPSKTSPDVSSFEDFCLYSLANINSGSMFPRFKAVDVTKTSFRILIEPLYPKLKQTWYLRWWAIPAQSTLPESVDPVYMEPRIEITDKNWVSCDTLQTVSSFGVRVVNNYRILDNYSEDSIKITLRIYPTDPSQMGGNYNEKLHYITENITLSRINKNSSLVDFIGTFMMEVNLTLSKCCATDASDGTPTEFNYASPLVQKPGLYALLDAEDLDLTISVDYTYELLDKGSLTASVKFNRSTATDVKSRSEFASPQIDTDLNLKSVQTSVLPLVPSEVYIGSKSGTVFHLSSCRSLPQEQNRVYFNGRQNAIDAGYTACRICKP